MAILQPLIDLVELCRLHGVTQAVVSPGSRSAALTLAFARNPHIHCTVVMDERAAGFIALGMAQQLGKPVVLLCTSGSAGYNFAPAVTEAYFQRISLLVLTADRPREWIHQNDGQTIYQASLYGRHVKAAYELPADYEHPDSTWFINRTVNEALLTAQDRPLGPVHINVPIREPFYPQPDENFVPSPKIRRIERSENEGTLPESVWRSLLKEWEGNEKILVAVGQHTPDEVLGTILIKLAEEFRIPVAGEGLANLPVHQSMVHDQDLILSNSTVSGLKPDILITIGQSFVSKSFKKFIRENPPENHWHISEDRQMIDPFKTLTRHINVAPDYFFLKLVENLATPGLMQNDDIRFKKTYFENWIDAGRRTKLKKSNFLEDLTTFSDLSSVNFVLKKLETPAQLHVANSMPIRYVTMLGINHVRVQVFANRGTSGIDGCVSTAVGAALITRLPVYLLVGDVAFFYDRNGLMLPELPPNLKIILLNNSGGTIFRMIDGPASQPELERYFETRHGYTARRTAEDAGLKYHLVENMEELHATWPSFQAGEGTSLLEIKTDPVIDAEVVKHFKKSVLMQGEVPY